MKKQLMGSMAILAIGIAALGVGGAGVVGAAAQEGISILGNSDYVYSAQGSTVTVDNSGQITTLGATAHGIVAHSSGGGGLLHRLEDALRLGDLGFRRAHDLVGCRSNGRYYRRLSQTAPKN